MAEEKIIKKLQSHPGTWRVDGVQEVRGRGRLGTGVKIIFSEVTAPENSSPYKTASRTSKVLQLSFHVATLKKLIIGSVWRNGELIFSPPIIHETVVADISRCRLVRLNENVNLKGMRVESVLPEAYYALGDNRKKMADISYALVPLLGTGADWLIVPCSELLRFYYGASTRLLSATLSGRLDNYVSWEKSRLVDSELILHVNQQLDRNEQYILCRAVACKDAKSEMLAVHNRLSATNANNRTSGKENKKPLVIQANFPFKDQTRLTIAGKKMMLAVEGKKEQWGIFAMHIAKCWHPTEFPATPTIESDFTIPSAASQIDNENIGQKRPLHYAELPEDFQDIPIGDEPSNSRLPRLTILNHSNQFAGMDELRFKYKYPNVPTPSAHPSTSIPVPIDSLSLGEGSNGKDAENTLGVGLHVNHVYQIDRDISLFLETLHCLREKIESRKWELETLALKNRVVEGNDVIAMFPQDFGKKWKWHQITEKDGKIRPRQVVISKITKLKDNKIFYILEMELRSGSTLGQCTIVLNSKSLTAIEDKELESLLRLTVIQNRWINEQNKWTKARDKKLADDFLSKHVIYRINHPKTQSEQIDRQTAPILYHVAPAIWATYLLGKIDDYFQS